MANVCFVMPTLAAEIIVVAVVVVIVVVETWRLGPLEKCFPSKR